MRGFVLSVWAVAGVLSSPLIAKEALSPNPAAAGKQVYDRQCAACHSGAPGYPPFAGLPGTEAIQVKYNGEVPALLTQRTDLTPDVITYFVRNGVSVMPAFRKTEISDADLVNLGAYLSGNNPALKGRRTKK